ncbi:MAG: YcgN family cysteine cluster protein [Geminicoccaceae bacterium]|jgi:uncharacterized cysteine cluster protein YcgN (CxxCxxCC family)|nr:YcgN family cysteine cluster protein [Geminicoccaceae bacterium]HRY24994.1 YcgN family cysteine cluster protein [Geminicoccaceae bacterium]
MSEGPKARPFWQAKPLAALTAEEWESLCDGCGKCCLVKLEDEAAPDTVYFTDVACRLLDLATCRCTDYASRSRLVPGCRRLGPDRLGLLELMPPSCAYRRIAEGRGLPEWHHLVSGDRSAIHRAGRSVRGRAVSESEVAEDALEDRIVEWPHRDC